MSDIVKFPQNQAQMFLEYKNVLSSPNTETHTKRVQPNGISVCLEGMHLSFLDLAISIAFGFSVPWTYSHIFGLS